MQNFGKLLMLVGGAMLLMLLTVALLDSARHSGYRQGQIDALTGKVTVELRTNPDSTKSWVNKDSSTKREWRTK